MNIQTSRPEKFLSKYLSLLSVIAVLILISLPRSAVSAVKPLVADLSQDTVEINSSFSGAEVLLYGSAVHEGDLYVILRGATRHYTVMKKERIGGVWVNAESRKYKNIPTMFRAYESSINKKFTEYQSDLFQIPESFAFLEGRETIDPFDNALVRSFTTRQLISEELERVQFLGETLFKLKLRFPASIVPGDYLVEVYLMNNKTLTAVEIMPIKVRKVGLDASIYDLSRQSPSLYGILAILLALGGGWLASYLFNRLNI